jgi:hypothetical protein
MALVKGNYELVYVSGPRGLAELWRRKDLAEDGAHRSQARQEGKDTGKGKRGNETGRHRTAGGLTGVQY